MLDDVVRLSLPSPGRTITLFNAFSFHRPLHHSIPSHSPFSLPPFLPAPEKLLWLVMQQCRKESGPCFYFITCDTPGHKRKPLSLLLFYSTLSPLHSRQTEPGHALHVALHIMMSLKSLFSSLPLNTLPLLLCSPSLALSFSVSLLLSPCSPSQPEPENKRDQTQVPSSSL